MRELTFLGFLKRYTNYLSLQNSNSIFKLSRELSQNPRLVEPLILYAIMSDKKDLLIRALKNSRNEYDVYFNLNKSKLIDELSNKQIKNIEMQKVWESYLVQKNKNMRTENTKQLMRDKIIKIKAEKNISNYRIYTDLKLNPGNINAWIKQSDVHKVSLNNARKILNYVSEY